MSKMLMSAAAALLFVGLSSTGALADACSGRDHTTGTVLGAAGGGIIGGLASHGNGLGIVGGALLGGMLGNSIGQSLDNADRVTAEQTAQRALETGRPGQALPWKGQSGYGTVTPSNYYQNPNGEYCREFTQTINVGGKSQQGTGTACRNPDGSWRIVSQ